MTAVVLRPARHHGPADVPSDEVDVVLIGFQDQGNLGMGYLAAVLHDHGLRVELVEFRDGPDAIAARVLAARPHVVGFSLIFQFYLPEYVALAQHLRDCGVDAHFTMGGHYPSLCHDEVLAAMPQLDSVARFEGEYTLLELVSALKQGLDWHAVPGLAYLVDGMVAEAEARHSTDDLDELPYPYRPYEPDHVVGWRTMPLLASRGCSRRCSFCSIQTFYRAAPGRVVRVRDAGKVADEMLDLLENRDVSIFLFQDDDFPLWGRSGHAWSGRLVDEFRQRELIGRAIWKISCRAEYVEPELFGRLRDAGLYLVYMGLESGSEEGLDILNKKISVETNQHAVRVLKDLGIMFQYGFMLFDPSSSFESVRTNIAFLRTIVGDGSAAALFCRMLPYGGTPIRDRLASEGRLKGDVVQPDYDFLDLRLNDYHQLLDAAVGPWVHGDGASFQLNCAWHELAVIERLVGELDGLDEYRAGLRALTVRSNAGLFEFVEHTATAFEHGDDSDLRPDATRQTCQRIVGDMLDMRNALVERNRSRLVGAVTERRILRGPILAPQRY